MGLGGASLTAELEGMPSADEQQVIHELERIIAGDPGRHSAEAANALPETDRRHAIAEGAGRKQTVDIQVSLYVLRVGEVAAQVIVELVPGEAGFGDSERA